MKKYIITIEEINDKDFEVYANNGENAMNEAIKKYKNGDFVLDPGNCNFRQIAVLQPPSESCEWVEF